MRNIWEAYYWKSIIVVKLCTIFDKFVLNILLNQTQTVKFSKFSKCTKLRGTLVHPHLLSAWLSDCDEINILCFCLYIIRRLIDRSFFHFSIMAYCNHGRVLERGCRQILFQVPHYFLLNVKVDPTSNKMQECKTYCMQGDLQKDRRR